MRYIAALLTVSAVTVAAAGWMGDPIPFPRPRRRWTTPHWLAAIRAQGITTRRLVITSAAAAAGTFAALWALTSAPLLAAVPALAVAAAPAVYHWRASHRAETERVRAWPDALRALRGSIATGESLHAACGQLARAGPPPLRPAFERYLELSRVLRQTEAFDAVRAELAHPVSDEIFYVLAAASRGGSRLTPDILDDLAEGVTADLQLDEAIETARTEPRLNAAAAALLPWIVLVVLTSRAGPLRDYYTSASSVGVLLIGAAATAAGMVWFAWLSRLKGRPRVLHTTNRETPL